LPYGIPLVLDCGNYPVDFFEPVGIDDTFNRTRFPEPDNLELIIPDREDGFLAYLPELRLLVPPPVVFTIYRARKRLMDFERKKGCSSYNNVETRESNGSCSCSSRLEVLSLPFGHPRIVQGCFPVTPQYPTSLPSVLVLWHKSGHSIIRQLVATGRSVMGVVGVQFGTVM
jgi:hypothetical protein